MSTDITYDEFLDSETVSLSTPDSSRSFRIHGKLLERKCNVIYTAFEKGFSEASRNQYTCKDTTEGTLVRFIEWAYTGDYTVQQERTEDTSAEPIVPADDDQPAAADDVMPEEEAPVPEPDDGEPAASEEITTSDVKPDKHPLLAHVRLYIFGGAYLIGGLKQHAFEKMKACLQNLDENNEFGMPLIAIAMMRKAFSEVSPEDDLLDWLARYASFRLDRLRAQSSFNDLLRAEPGLGARMVGLLSPRLEPPWPPKYQPYIY